jgi:glutamate 5-kinase
MLGGADKLLLLTDQQGLFTADPRNNPDAELIGDVITLMPARQATSAA